MLSPCPKQKINTNSHAVCNADSTLTPTIIYTVSQKKHPRRFYL